MEEKWAHRALTRWSRIADLVPEWMWWAHLLLAAAFALALVIVWEIGVWPGFFVWLGTAALLTLGLFRRASAIVVAVLGTVVATATGAFVVGSLLFAVVHRVLVSDAALYPCLAVGAALGAWLALDGYGPFVKRLRNADCATER